MRWGSVGERKVDSYCKTDLASTKDILQEGVTLLDFKLYEVQFVVATQRLLLLVSDLVFFCAFLELA